MLSMTSEEAVRIAKSEEQNQTRRILAVIRISSDITLDVETLFYSHATILNFFGASIVRSTAAEFLVSIVGKIWPGKMISTFALQSPRLTVPAVLAACVSDLPPLQKSAKILLEVQQAIGIRLPKSYQDQLNLMASKAHLA